MSFAVKTFFYKTLMSLLKIVIKLVPQPTPLLFTGQNSALALARQIAVLGKRKALLVTDANLMAMGIADDICRTLAQHSVEVVVFDAVRPDPVDTLVEQGARLCADQQCDCVLGVGGGSSLDAAKMIAALDSHPGKTVRQLAGILKFKSRATPLFLVPSTAGTGSEVTAVAVISCRETHRKMLVVDPRMIATSAAIDPVIMQGLPPGITAETGIDALTHAIESFISGHRTPATDANALAAIKLIFANLEKCYADGGDLAARGAVALASTYAGLAFSSANVGYVHAIAHQLGSTYQVPHGLANALILPHILEYSEPASRRRFARLAGEIGIPTAGKTDHQLSLAFIASVRALIRQLNIPATLDSLDPDDIDTLAANALKEAHYLYPVPRYMDMPACRQVIRQLLAPATQA